MPAWQCLPKFLKDTSYENPSDMMHTPFQIGHNMNQPAFVWAMSQPQRVQNFNLWMAATHQGQKSWLDVLPLETLFHGSKEGTYLFVDIGGGIGHQCASLKERLAKDNIKGVYISGSFRPCESQTWHEPIPNSFLGIPFLKDFS